MSTPHPHTILFARGTLARLALWPTLRLAVYASWGGPASAEKQRWLAGVLVDQFEPFIVAPPTPIPVPGPGPGPSAPPRARPPSLGATTPAPPPPDAAHVEDLLLQIMADEFDVVLEDDSAAAVARDIVRLFRDVCAGDETFVNELEVQAERVKGKLPKYEMGVGSASESESESGSEWEDEDDEEGEGVSEEERVPQLLNHSEHQTREGPQVDEDGFTMVRKKGSR